jgi:hypothetical protein
MSRHDIPVGDGVNLYAASRSQSEGLALVALSGGRAVALLPLDYLAWTEQAAGTRTEIAERSKRELGAKGLQMQLTGRVSDRARTELQSRGWAVQERARRRPPRRQC